MWVTHAFTGATPEYTVWVMASAVMRAYNRGMGAMPPVGSRGKARRQGSGAKPPEADSNLTVNWAILRSEFDYLNNLTLWCVQIFYPLLLTCCITMPLMQKKRLCCKASLLESCSGGWIIHVWGLPVALGGLSPFGPLVLAPVHSSPTTVFDPLKNYENLMTNLFYSYST